MPAESLKQRIRSGDTVVGMGMPVDTRTGNADMGVTVFLERPAD